MFKDTNLSHLNPDDRMIVIAGGGIAGLYAARELAKRPDVSTILLLEASADRWGGRIETERLDGFIAEFGPMRFEPKLQRRFDTLVQSLGIEYEPFNGPEAGTIDFPVYDLARAERQPDGRTPLNALELLRRGILLILGRTLGPDDPAGLSHQGWLDEQTEVSYQRLRETVELDGRALWEMGFWNALTAPGILSHQAMMKIRDTGTFYHMIPTNLNAAEWVIWWMRALTTDGKVMHSLVGGTVELVTRLRAALPRKVVQVLGAELLAFHTVDGKIQARVRVGNQVGKISARHLILAMPRAPLVKLAPSLPPQIVADLDAVDGFPMIKVFFATRAPWWDDRTRPQTRAHRMPTREVHYFYRPADKHGMALIYTDSPATEYWRHHVLDKRRHDRAEIYAGDENRHLRRQFARFLAQEALADLAAVEAAGLTPAAGLAAFAGLDLEQSADRIEESVTAYAIRDWARAPYGAANHSWKPGVKSWEVQSRLAAFAPRSGGPARVHVCGEAYSDYSGFIEGALRSVHRALERIPVLDDSNLKAVST